MKKLFRFGFALSVMKKACQTCHFKCWWGKNVMIIPAYCEKRILPSCKKFPNPTQQRIASLCELTNREVLKTFQADVLEIRFDDEHEYHIRIHLLFYIEKHKGLLRRLR